MSPESICQKKIRYKTGPEALKKARIHSKEYNNAMTPYSCPICYGWHLRSSKPIEPVMKPVQPIVSFIKLTTISKWLFIATKMTFAEPINAVRIITIDGFRV